MKNLVKPFDYVSYFSSVVNSKTKYLPSLGKLYNLKFQNKVIKQNIKKTLPIKRWSSFFCAVLFYLKAIKIMFWEVFLT